MIQVTEWRPERLGATSPRPLRPREAGLDDQLRGWLVTAFLTAFAALTRFINLNHPTDAGTPVFDEKYYTSQGWQMLTNGMWIEDNPAYSVIVHPPVGKMVIALGEALFGYNAWGWRFSAAVAGTLMVLMVIRIARRLTRSTLVGAIAGILMITESVTFVQSRIGMLDIFLAFFVTAAFGCLIVDRDEIRARMKHADFLGRTTLIPYGPRLGVRWWRFGAGVFLGLACGTKWSGIYFLAAFFLLSLAFSANARNAYGVAQSWVGTVVRDLGSSVYALIVIPWAARLVSASLASFDPAIEEAAKNLGAGPWTTFRRVTLPSIRPGIVAGALFGFVTSFGNLEMSLFLVGAGRTTLPIAILQYLEWKIDPTIAAVSVLQILFIGGAMLLTDRFVKIGRVV